MVVVPASGEERRLVAELLLELEAEHVAVEGDRALEVGNLEVHVADADARIDHASRA